MKVALGTRIVALCRRFGVGSLLQHGEDDMSAEKMRTQGLGRFVDYDKSGAVSLRASEFLRSEEGKKQLDHARELRKAAFGPTLTQDEKESI